MGNPLRIWEICWLIVVCCLGYLQGQEVQQVADTKFDPDRGFYETPFNLMIASETPEAQIVYTLDGRSPLNAQGQPIPEAKVYTGPIPISKTTCVRAAAIKTGWQSTNVDTHTYLFLDDVQAFTQNQALQQGYPATWYGNIGADYGMDPKVVTDPQYRDLIKTSLLSLPTMSMVIDKDHLFNKQKDPETGGIYIYTGHSSTGGQGWERPGSMEFFGPNEPIEFQVNCGIRIQGGENRRPSKCPKHGFSMRFRAEYGQSRLKEPLFDGPVKSFDSLQLRGFYNNTWIHADGNQRNRAQYVRDQWMRDTMRAMGHADAGQGRYVHLYINGMYWGLYNLQERPVADHYAQYNGGDPDQIDAINGGTATDGTNANWNALRSVASTGDWEDVEQLLDVDNFIDYTLLNFYGGNQDIKTNGNWRAAGGGANAAPWHMYPWDGERVLENVNASIVTRPSADPTRLLMSLLEREVFVRRFGDRIQKHTFYGGALTPEVTTATWQKRATEIDLAVIAESARWGDYRQGTPLTRNKEWITERDRLVHEYFPQRTEVFLQQLQNQHLYPQVSPPMIAVDGELQHGGHILKHDQVSLLAPGATTIRYSLNGTDPRQEVSTPIDWQETVLVSEDALKRVMVPLGNISDTWRGGDNEFNDSRWLEGTGGVGYETSSGFEPYFSMDLQELMYLRRTSCYIRIPFLLKSAEFLEIEGLILALRYDDGFVAYLNGQEVKRDNVTGNITWQSFADQARDESATTQLTRFDISHALSSLKVGTNILAIQGLNNIANSSDLLISTQLLALTKTSVSTPHPNTAQAGGQVYEGPFTFNQSSVLKTAAFNGSTWSALNETVFAVGPITENLRITEIMYHPPNTGSPQDPNAEFIELMNIGSETINLNRVSFNQGIRFTFSSVDVAPGELIILAKDPSLFTERYGNQITAYGPYEGKLSNSGETIKLIDAVGTPIQDFRYDDWYDKTDGKGYSLIIKDPHNPEADLSTSDAWQAGTTLNGTPGSLN